MKLLNPYREKQGRWVRGNFHGHTSEGSGCATVSLREGVKQYHDIGAAFMAVTDHDVLTDLGVMRAEFPGIVCLQGFEHSRSHHLLFIGEEVPPLYELPLGDALAQADDLLTILCHPEPTPGEEYWSRRRILSIGQLPDGIEVFNGHYGTEKLRARGRNPLYTHLWDEMLTKGHRLWGFTNDDFHDPADFGNAYNMVLVEEVTPVAVIRAAKAGAFYGTTGLMLREVSEEDGRIVVAVEQPCEGRFVGPQGKVLSASDGDEFEYTVSIEPYVRFEAEGDQGLLFLQPMFAAGK